MSYTLLGIALILLAIIFVIFLLQNVRVHGLIVMIYPAFFMCFFYIAYFLLPSAGMLFLRDVVEYRYVLFGYSFEAWAQAQLFAFIFITFTLAVSLKVYSLPSFVQSITTTVRTMDIGMQKNKNIYIIIFWALPVLSLLFSVYKFGGANYQEYMLNRTASRKGLGYILMPSFWMSITLTVFFVKRILLSRQNRAFAMLFFFIALLFYIAVNLYLGSKSRGLIVIVYCIVCSYAVLLGMKKVSIKSIIMTLALVVLITGVGLKFGDIRESVVAQKELSDVESRAKLGKVFSKLNAFGAIENTIWSIDNLSSNDYLLGKTFYVIFAAPVPRSIWPNKPVGGGPALRNFVHPDSYDIVSGRQLTSYSPGIIAEAYMNFSYVGCIFVAFLWAMLLVGFAYSVRYIKNILGFVVWAICLYGITYALTAEVYATLTRLLMFIFPVVLFSFASHIFIKKIK